MTPHRQVKSFQKQELLKCNDTGSEAKRKQSFTSARLSEIQGKFRAMKRQQIIDMQTIDKVKPVQESYQLRPFPETHLGRIAPELRILIYHELVASPPTHAGQELTTRGSRLETQGPQRPAAPKTTFVHLHASCLAVLATCRQVYVEAHPVFYARTSYYAANAKELEQLIRLNSPFVVKSPLRTNMITSLCVKYVASYKESLHPFMKFWARGTHFRNWESLRKIYLCMRAGEELGFIKFLFLLPDMEYGVVEFLDDSRWVTRLQRPEEVWKIQYACFCFGIGIGKGKGGVELSYADILRQRRLLKVESRDPRLEEGQECLVEVDIDAPLEKCMSRPMQAMMNKFSDLSIGSNSRASSSGASLEALVEEMAVYGCAE